MQKPVSSYFSDFLFYEKPHRYVNRFHPDDRYTSSTGAKKLFTNPFRREYWIAWDVVKQLAGPNRCCDYGARAPVDHFKVNGSTFHYSKVWDKYPEECHLVNVRWTQDADEGKDKGSQVHNFLENLARRIVLPTKSKYAPWINSAVEYWREEMEDTRVVMHECEIILGDRDTLVAGMADRLAYLGDWDLKLVDYKSDKKFSDTDSFQQLLHPFGHLPQNSMTEYSIQVNIYRELIEKRTPYKVVEMELVNITDEGHKRYAVPKLEVLKYIPEKLLEQKM